MEFIAALPVIQTSFPTLFLKLLGSTVAVVALVLLGIAWYRKRKKNDSMPILEEQSTLSAQSLRGVWRGFMQGIPREFRQAIMGYQHYIVLGETGSGKSAFINQFTDWEGRAYQFPSSHTFHNLLHLYIGAKEIVHELAAPLLNDKSFEARSALVNLWKPLFTKSPPTVIICLDASQFSSSSPEHLKRQAQMLRGKINLLSWICKTPVKLRINLTHSDKLPGFEAFSALLNQENIAFEIPLSANSSEEELLKIISSYERYLPLALLKLPPEVYHEVISFFKKISTLLTPLVSFLEQLKKRDSLSLAPLLETLYMTSSTTSCDYCNPFFTSQRADIVKKSLSLFTHQIVCASLTMVGLIYLTSIYFSEKDEFEKTQEIVTSFEKYQSLRPLHNSLQKIHAFAARDHFVPTLLFLPRFFSGAEVLVGNRFAESTRSYILSPLLNKSVTGQYNPTQTLYILALMYASNENQLGKLIVENKTSWAQMLGLQESLIETYVELASFPWDYSIPLDDIPPPKKQSAEFDFQPWMVFLDRVQSYYDSTHYLLDGTLDDFQAQAKDLLKVLDNFQRFNLSLVIVNLLAEETNIDIKNVYSDKIKVNEWVNAQGENLAGFLRLVLQSSLDIPDVKGITINRLLTNIKAMQALQITETKTYDFSLSRKHFSFDSKKWLELLTSSRIRNMLQTFMTEANKNDRHKLFFAQEGLFPNIEMNPYSNGTLFFTGKGVIDGCFTKAAYEKKVKPILENIGKTIDNLPISASDIQIFSKFILQTAEQYAISYREEYSKYYDAFNMEAASIDELAIILSQMLRSSSPFIDFLNTVSDNVSIDQSNTSLYLRPMQRQMAPFQFISSLMVEDKGAHPELDKYLSIIRQIHSKLQDPLSNDKSNFNSEQEKGDIFKDLKLQLSPCAAMSLAMLRNSPDSYQRLLNQWMGSLNIHSDFAAPFSTPIKLIYSFGLKQVESSVNRLWRQKMLSKLLPMFIKFPFNSKASEDLSPQELIQFLHPVQGSFWSSFNKFIRPLSELQDGKWQALKTSQESFNLDETIYPIVNHMTMLTERLWDKSGTPKTLEFMMKTVPFTKGHSGTPTVILSYLTSGKVSLFNFNQQPAWSPFAIEWWTPDSANIGIQISKDGIAQPAYQALVVPPSPWSFFHLLSKAHEEGGNTWIWNVPYEGDPKKGGDVAFTLQEQPWSLFQFDKQEQSAIE